MGKKSLSEIIVDASFILYYDIYAVVIKNNDGLYYSLLEKGKEGKSEEIKNLGEVNHRLLLETPVAKDIYYDTDITDFYDEEENEGIGVVWKNVNDLIEIERKYQMYLASKEFESKRRIEISQLIHPEVSQFWDWRFLKIKEKLLESDISKTDVSLSFVTDFLTEKLLSISKEHQMYFSKEKDPETNRDIFYLNLPCLGKEDASFRTRLCIGISADSIILKIEPNITKEALRFSLNEYETVLKVIELICNEDFTPLNQRINQIIDKVWLNYTGKEMALKAIKLVLKQKKIECELFPETLSVRISFYVPIIRKSISQRIYYREFNDNPGVLHEIEKYAKEY